MFKLGSVATLLAMLTGAMGAGSAEALELRFAHSMAPSSYGDEAANAFKAYVEEHTDGEITVAIFPAGQMGGANEMLTGTRQGTLDISMAGNPWFTSFNPVQNVLDIPFIFEDHDHVYRVLEGPVGEAISDSLEPHGLKAIAFWEIGFRNVINNVRPIREPADLEGITLRTTGNPAHIKAFELLGANPQPMPFGEVYLALETDVVDGTEHPVNEVYAMNFHEVTENLSLTQHAYTAMVVVMNASRWDSLSDEHKAVIEAAAKEATDLQRELLEPLNASRLQAIKDSGVAVVEDVDRAAFREIVYDEVKAAYEAEHGTELTTAIEAARQTQ